MTFLIVLLVSAILGGLGVLVGFLGGADGLAVVLVALALALPLVYAGSWLLRARPKKGVLDGRHFRVYGRTIEVEATSAHSTTLGRRELVEIASGIATPRTGTHAVNPEHREAVATLVASGRETILFIEHDGLRFEGFERGSASDIIRALIKLAGPGFILSRHADHAVCPFCKEGVAEAPRPCETCQTVHHDDCYLEHGGCAVYGCERSPSGRNRGKAHA
ncbi:MAG: hypothetical protein ACAI25_04510 [Planctomycetota bacterium]